MKVLKTCPFTGKLKVRDLDVTDEEMQAYLSEGVLLQNAFPRLNAEEREFVKTGIDGEAWKKYVVGEDE
jgi:hypothetical protein